MLNPLQRALLLLLGLSGGLAAQTNLDLRALASGRGLVALGAGGLLGTPPLGPPFEPVAGRLGASVSWADLNGDGFDELILGAPNLPGFPASGQGDHSGHVFIVFGRADAANPGQPGDLDLVTASCIDVLDLVGGLDERFGASVAAAGDVDQDGFDDLIVGAPECGPNFRGAAYLLYGAADLGDLPAGLPSCHQFMPDLLGSRATLLTGSVAFGTAGASVGGGVDVNADGFADVIVGAPLASVAPRIQNGTASVLYGTAGLAGMASVDLGSLSVGQGSVVRGAQDFQLLGQSVAGLGRFDPVLSAGGEHATLGDEVAIGAPGTTGSAGLFSGAVYVLRGVVGGSHAGSYDSDDFGAAPGSAGPVWFGASLGDQAGSFVASAGDLIDPGDGFVELLVGAPLHDGLGRSDAGALYLLAGRRGGVGPFGFALSDIGSSGVGEEGLRFVGPVSFVGQQGLAASGAGDFDTDGLPDLALGVPGATVSDVIPVQAQAGTVSLIDGNLLQPPLDRSIDLASLGSAQLMRLRGETAGSLAGSALALGDHDGDGQGDLAIGSPGAPSDPDPLDPSGIGLSQTGRGQALFGPLLRPAWIDPAQSWFDGPVVEVGVFNLDTVLGVGVKLDGQPAALESVVAGSPGVVRFFPPVPAVPGAVSALTIETPETSVTLADAYTSLALAIQGGPDPAEVVPGANVSFTGVAFSNDLSVTINGAPANVLEVDPLAGTLSVEAPAGQPPFTALDVSLVGSNGSVLLPDAISYRPFIVVNVTPDTGPQDSGVYFEGPSLSFFGQPVVPVTFDMITSSGSFPPETTVEFGSDLLGWREAPVTGTLGTQVTVELPRFALGPQDTPVDLRVTTNLDQLVLADGFTYLSGDFTDHPGTASAGFGIGPPRVLMAGGFAPGESMLLLLDNYPKDEITLGVLMLGIDLADPPVPLKGGLLGTLPLFQLQFPGSFLQLFDGTLPSNPALVPTPDQDGLSLFLQFVTVEQSGPTTAYGFSDVLEMTARAP